MRHAKPNLVGLRISSAYLFTCAPININVSINMELQTPKRSTNQGEYDTIRKTSFFKAVDERAFKNLRLPEVFKNEGISKPTGHRWLKQREQGGLEAYRRLGKYRSGRPLTVSDPSLNQIVDTSNPVRDQSYEVQINHFNLNVSKRTLQKDLRKRKRNA